MKNRSEMHGVKDKNYTGQLYFEKVYIIENICIEELPAAVRISGSNAFPRICGIYKISEIINGKSSFCKNYENHKIYLYFNAEYSDWFLSEEVNASDNYYYYRDRPEGDKDQGWVLLYYTPVCPNFLSRFKKLICKKVRIKEKRNYHLLQFYSVRTKFKTRTRDSFLVRESI